MHDTEGETIDDVRRQRDELGIQLAALRERLRLAMAVVEAARRFVLGCDDQMSASAVALSIDDALAAFDEVPGDILERP